MKRDYLQNINDILTEGIIEGQTLNNIDVLKEIFKDNEISNLLYKNFKSNFDFSFSYDDLYMKTQDLVYRVNLLVDNLIVPLYGDKDFTKIKNEMKSFVQSDIDLYSAVSYDDSDKEFIEEIESDFHMESMRI